MAKQATVNAILTSKVVFLNWINGFIVFPFSSPLRYFPPFAGPEKAKNQRAVILRLIQIRLAGSSLEKISLVSQDYSPELRIADSFTSRCNDTQAIRDHRGCFCLQRGSIATASP